MLIFCPTCGNILTLQERSLVEENRFYCMTCPYVQVIEAPVAIGHTNQDKKEVAHLIGDNAGVGKAKADIKCPKCEHPEAWFHQMQTRSADEASTIFYECCNPKCKHKWNDR
mmetsp:Transcript_17518/g.45818  ORF Transcript_17518/g.45818 Transcript_17518/m.45818 type:complete len:112 (-) Transcript_17518:170-505(-)